MARFPWGAPAPRSSTSSSVHPMRLAGSAAFLVHPDLMRVVFVAGACRFPEAWSGRWFQSGVTQLLAINASLIETKGSCVENDGDKYILEDKWEQCFRCVVIHEKHHNVLQYKETFCVPRGPLEQLCGEITGDATLFSMFRSDAAPVACPFKGPFSFTYNRGSGECARPPSRIDSCAEDSQFHKTLAFLVSFCLASNSKAACVILCKSCCNLSMVQHIYENNIENKSYYKSKLKQAIILKVKNTSITEAKKHHETFDGIKINTNFTSESHASQCKFPGWVTEHHHWRTLDHRRSFQFSHKNATLRISNETSRDDEAGTTSLELRATCHSQLDVGERHVLLVAHVTLGCESGYMCMLFQRRDTHVIELQQTSNFAHAADEACQSSNFDVSMLPFITLVTASLKPRKCPYLGRYTVSSLTKDGARASRSRSASSAVTCSSEELESLVVGCRATDTMEFHSSCGTEPVSGTSVVNFCHHRRKERNIVMLQIIY
ncbi:hypothetical protein B566_EDAN004600 [Ephemera danica]|nr:hypothetical protein B566_EDAN004600 [Ephemera danica]